MSATIEQRLESVETELAALKARFLEPQPWLSPSMQKDPLSIFGASKDDPLFEEAVRLGEEWRAGQTYEKEIEARGGSGY
ncbi:MAG: hypothetical protein JWR15_4623 [Prosthecobacter sp.]|nr:hypothetical protein [Prosthecobacter sp.]